MLKFNGRFTTIGALILIGYIIYQKYEQGEYSSRGFGKNTNNARYTVTVAENKAYEEYSWLEKLLLKFSGTKIPKKEALENIVQPGQKVLVEYQLLNTTQDASKHEKVKRKVVIAGRVSDKDFPLENYVLGLSVGEKKKFRLVTEGEQGTMLEHEVEVHILKIMRTKGGG